MTVKKKTLYQFLKKETNKTSKIIAQSLFFQSVVTFSNVSYAINMLKYFLGNNLITPKQSGFRSGNFCINHLLSITHDICTSFDNGLAVRGVFLDILKAFDKVWLDGLISKLKQNEIKDKLLCLLIDFLKNSQQRVVLSGQSSYWTKVNAGLLQGTLLGSLLFWLT